MIFRNGQNQFSETVLTTNTKPVTVKIVHFRSGITTDSEKAFLKAVVLSQPILKIHPRRRLRYGNHY
jgi:hypothetical protein